MALTVENLATPDRDSRILHSSSKGTKMAVGDLKGIATDGAGKFVLNPKKVGMKKLNHVQGWGNAGGIIGIVFLEIFDIATNTMIVLQQDGSALASTTLTTQLVHFTALGQ